MVDSIGYMVLLSIFWPAHICRHIIGNMQNLVYTMALVLQLVWGLYAKVCPLKMASDNINMMLKEQENVRYCSYLVFLLSIGMILR